MTTTVHAQEKPALVFLCQRIPYPPNKGERITSFNLLRHLVRHYRVFVGTFVDDPEDRKNIETLRGMVTGLFVGEVKKPWAYVQALPGWLTGEPISYAIFRDKKLGQWLEGIEAREHPVAVVTNSSNISAYATDWFKRNGQTEPRRILHFADVDSEKFVAYAAGATGLKRWIFAEEARRVRREEKRLTAASDKVAFVSDEEAALFRAVLEKDHERVVTLPNGVDADLFDRRKYTVAPFVSRGAVFVFTGNMDYLPNIEAVKWFVKNVFPLIQVELPEAQFLIVGAKPTDEILQLTVGDSVLVTGRVESVAAYLAFAQVAVAPLRIARGIQNKVLEAMAMAMPVVASSGALTGIAAKPGQDIVCADTVQEWLRACVDLVKDKERAYQMGNSARELVLGLYNWNAQFAKLDKLLLPD